MARMFRRRHDHSRGQAPEEQTGRSLADGTLDEGDEPVDEPAGPPNRTSWGGPYDAAEREPEPGSLRMGALTLPPLIPGVQLTVQGDPATGAVSSIVLLGDEAALEVSAFAAPRSAGLWAQVRRELAAGLSTQGGVVDEAVGPFGPELRVRLAARAPDGSEAVQPLRFVGVDGPRWFVRGVLSGRAALDEQAAAPFERWFAALVVDRGAEAMAPRTPLPLHLPESGAGQDPAGTAEPGAPEA